MLEDSPTHGSIVTTHAQKRLYAKESLAFNVKNKYHYYLHCLRISHFLFKNFSGAIP